ncbi:MAG: hypothetical protein FWG87_05010 [Defluviitaleaceae bacterium]|nr:hypothetical protein [Defluviitaleaceae bacterium]
MAHGKIHERPRKSATSEKIRVNLRKSAKSAFNHPYPTLYTPPNPRTRPQTDERANLGTDKSVPYKTYTRPQTDERANLGTDKSVPYKPTPPPTTTPHNNNHKHPTTTPTLP